MRFGWELVCVLIALASGGSVLSGGCGGTAAPGLDGGGGGGPSDAAPDRVGSSCVPLPGCTSTTTCPSDCNTCACIDGAWACTLVACKVGLCCPPDPHPGCCMKYGGWSNADSCATTCDGMPESGDPAWHQVSDSHGCAVWSSQGSSGPLCGEPPDAAVDGSADAARDAGACVSLRGGRCGGNKANPCSCAAGLVCTPGDGGPPFGDVGGTCADEGDGAAVDGDAASDADALDRGRDGGLCQWSVDAGGQQRWCPSGTQCCGGGAVGTVICYSGTGPCPALP